MADITCGRCTKVARDTVKHGSVATVRACYAAPTSFIEDQWHADAEAEIAAEQACERFWEERGVDDGFDDWERSRGVIDFSTAMALAEGR